MKYLFFILIVLQTWQVKADTLYVGKTRQFNTIAEAITKANSNDVVIVSKGIYHEKNLVINKPMVLKGINYPVLDGENKYEIISIKANNVTVDGFKVQHSGVSSMTDFAGIKIYNARNVNICLLYTSDAADE